MSRRGNGRPAANISDVFQSVYLFVRVTFFLIKTPMHRARVVCTNARCHDFGMELPTAATTRCLRKVGQTWLPVEAPVSLRPS